MGEFWQRDPGDVLMRLFHPYPVYPSPPFLDACRNIITRSGSPFLFLFEVSPGFSRHVKGKPGPDGGRHLGDD